MARQFSKIHEVRGMQCENNKAYEEVMYAKLPALGVRIMKATRHGTIKKTYFARFTKEKGGKRVQVKENVAVFDEITLEDAILRVTTLITENDKNSVLVTKTNKNVTIKQAFELFVQTRRHNWSAATLDDYNKKYKHLTAIEDYKMCELDMRFWEARYDSQRQNHPEAAKKVAKLVMALYKQEKIDNPFTSGTITDANKKSKKRQNYVTEDKFGHFWHYVHTYAHPSVRDFALVILFMGFRLSLVANLSWSRVDLENATYRIDADDVGNKLKKPALLPIPKYLIDNVFLPRFAIKTADYVIESNRRKKTGLRAIKDFLDRASEATELHLNHHSLRRTFSTYAQRSSRDTITVAHLMLHGGPDDSENFRQTLDYIMTDMSEMRRVSELTSEYIQKLVKKQGK